MKKRWSLLALLLALPACGGGPSYGYPDVEPSFDEDVELTQEQVQAEQQLDEVLARPEPDCAAACDLGARICDLSTRICALAHRNPHSPEIASRCTDADGRCQSARMRIAEVCPCGG